jgi:molybdopterin synthase sulfur carrier subunit
MIHVLYFARLREQLNTGAEAMEYRPQLDTVNALVAILKARGDVWAELFADDQLVMVAVNQEMSDRNSPLKDGDEVAFFPPVTGG